MKICYVPLDNRPVNLLYPLKIAKSVNLKVLTPPKEYLGNFLIPGKGNKILSWLLENKSDILIISLDMLLFGGLISSRKKGVTFNGANERLNFLRKIRKNFSKILAFNVLMRISISVTNEEEYQFYKKIILYSKTEDETIKKEIPQDILEEYLEVRKRNHHINLKAIDLVKEGIIDYLIISQEDAEYMGLHKREQEELLKRINELKVSSQVSLHPGTDEVGQVLFCRLINKEKNFNPKIFVFPKKEDGLKIISLYEDRTIKESIQSQVKAVGGMLIESDKRADLILAVNTPDVKQKDLTEYEVYKTDKKEEEKFVLGIKNFLNDEKKVSVVDLAYSNGGDELFIKLLSKNLELEKLSSFSAWNTSSNSIGSALAIGCLNLLPDFSEKSHKENLLIHFFDDYIYQSIVRKKINNYIKENLPVSCWNLKKYHKEVEKQVVEEMNKEVKKFLSNNFSQVSFKKLNFYLPWQRTFEIGIDLVLN